MSMCEERPVNAAATGKLMLRKLDASSMTVSAVLTEARHPDHQFRVYRRAFDGRIVSG